MNCKDINSLDMIEVLNDLGYRHVSKNQDEYMYLAKYRNDSSPSLCVNPTKRYWYDFGVDVGGKLVDLIMLIIKASEVSEVIAYCNKRYNHLFSFSEQNDGRLKEKNKSYTITKVKKPVDNSLLISYLNERGISRNSWSEYVLEVHYENQYGKFYAIGFKNDLGGMEVRNKLMKNPICLGTKCITTIPGLIDNVAVFEGFFDFLSFIELGFFNGQTVIVLNTTSKVKTGLKYIIENYPNAKVETYLDNDDAGILATKEIKNTLNEVTSRSNLFVGFNDLNDYLKATKRSVKLTQSESIKSNNISM